MPEVRGRLIRILPAGNVSKNGRRFRLRLTLFVAAFMSFFHPASWANSVGAYRPDRVLLIIGGQWDDPSSFLIRTDNELHEIASLLKHWGTPFDILRLDQQKLDRSHFLDFTGKPRYGAILWDADPVAFGDQNARDIHLLQGNGRQPRRDHHHGHHHFRDGRDERRQP